MEKLILAAPENALPEQGTPAYDLLALLVTEGQHRDDLCNKLGGGARAYIHQLTGNKYLNWLIHSERRIYKGRNQSFYWLDDRHLSCDWEADRIARAEARKRDKNRTYYGRRRAASGLGKAWSEKIDADREYQELTGGKKLEVDSKNQQLTEQITELTENKKLPLD